MSIDVGIDWIQGVINCQKVNNLFEFFNSLLEFRSNDMFKWGGQTKMGQVFDNSAISITGLRVGYSENDKGVKGFFVVPGSYLNYFDFTTQLKILELCFNHKITRIDLAFNDYQKLIKPNQLNEWAINGYLRGFKIHSSLREDFRTFGSENLSMGTTKSFGRRSSEKYLRIYESKFLHKYDAIRWELENKDDRARALNFLFNCSNPQSEISKIICGSISFDYKDHSRKDRCTLLPEWEFFLDYVGGSEKISIQRETTPFDKKVDWLFRQCSKTLAMAHRHIGKRIVNELLIIGDEKITLFDEEFLKFYSQQRNDTDQSKII